MADYSKSLEAGFEAARKAEAGRKEVEEVFQDLHDQILKASNGTISIDRREFSEPFTMEMMAGIGNPLKTPKKYWAIIGSNPKVKKSAIKELARWEMDNNGYPCIISWENQRNFCENKEALVSCLSDLLKDSQAAEKLYLLTKLESDKVEE